MALPPKATFPLFLFLLLPLLLLSLVLATTTQQEEFSEELLLKPLPDRKILAHFHFQNEAPLDADSFARHHHLFPKSISQLGFLHIDEYPPDANQGFDIPSAIISFPDFNAGLQFYNKSQSKSPLLSKLQEKSPVLSYTEVLLVPLTTPDFSMPYNVITITCTVFALYFGSLVNVLRRRVGEEERLLKNKDASKAVFLRRVLTKLSAKLRGRPLQSTTSPSSSSSSSSFFVSPKLILRVLLVAGIAIAWQYYSQ